MNAKNRGSTGVGPLKRHALSLVTAAILIAWITLYKFSDPQTHWGSFFGNAIADWSGVLVAVVATKYFYEIGSAKSNQPKRRFQSRLLENIRNHSLTVFLTFTGVAWIFLYTRMDSEGKWGQVVGNIVSEWTQLLGLVILTKKLIEVKSNESR
jgi:membrane protease YdiL (CAAX protease family)